MNRHFPRLVAKILRFSALASDVASVYLERYANAAEDFADHLSQPRQFLLRERPRPYLNYCGEVDEDQQLDQAVS